MGELISIYPDEFDEEQEEREIDRELEEDEEYFLKNEAKYSDNPVVEWALWWHAIGNGSEWWHEIGKKEEKKEKRGNS